MKKQNFLRWYEKDEYLKAFMSLLEGLSKEAQCEIAIDIIMRATSLIDRDYSKIIEDVGSFDPKDFKRWYDKNPNIHLAIESLRDLNDEQRSQIVQELSEDILNRDEYKIPDLDLKNINLESENDV